MIPKCSVWVKKSFDTEGYDVQVTSNGGNTWQTVLSGESLVDCHILQKAYIQIGFECVGGGY